MSTLDSEFALAVFKAIHVSSSATDAAEKIGNILAELPTANDGFGALAIAMAGGIVQIPSEYHRAFVGGIGLLILDIIRELAKFEAKVAE
jgi:hypothetical protein